MKWTGIAPVGADITAPIACFKPVWASEMDQLYSGPSAGLQ